MPIAPATLFVPQPISSTRALRDSISGSTLVSVLLIEVLFDSRPFGLDSPECPVNLLFPALAFQIQPGVHPRIQILHLFFHFGIALVPASVERAVLERFPHRAPRFVLMTAVSEVTGGGYRLNVGEREIQ